MPGGFSADCLLCFTTYLFLAWLLARRIPTQNPLQCFLCYCLCQTHSIWVDSADGRKQHVAFSHQTMFKAIRFPQNSSVVFPLGDLQCHSTWSGGYEAPAPHTEAWQSGWRVQHCPHHQGPLMPLAERPPKALSCCSI